MLYVVPVPVGNLEDITLRAIRLFKETLYVIAEDSRNTKKLFKLLEIQNNPKFIDITKNHTLNSYKILQTLELAKKENVLLVTDSGTPGISDPGLEIVKMAILNSVPYTTLPGATSIIPAVINSGLIFKEFLFKGFLPLKKGRQKMWQEISNSSTPIVLLESVHRIEKFLLEARQYLQPDRQIFINREISKLNESFYRFKTRDIDKLEIKIKGEFVVVIEGLIK
jgi:16S rRNA (cytidine1402-2'-O)-methyltransferase